MKKYRLNVYTMEHLRHAFEFNAKDDKHAMEILARVEEMEDDKLVNKVFNEANRSIMQVYEYDYYLLDGQGLELTKHDKNGQPVACKQTSKTHQQSAGKISRQKAANSSVKQKGDSVMCNLISFQDDLGNADYSQYVGLTGLVVKTSRAKKYFDEDWRIFNPPAGYDPKQHATIHDHAVIVRLLKLEGERSSVITLMVPAACLEGHLDCNDNQDNLASGVFEVGGWNGEEAA